MSFNSEDLIAKLDKFREENFYPSWDDVSDGIGISRKTLQRWRNGKVPGKRTLAKVDYFLNNNDYDNSVKECTRCGETKVRSVEYFRRDGERKDGLSSICKDCINSEPSPDRSEYYKKNKNKILKNNKEWLENNREARNEWRRSYYDNNREQHLEYAKRWAQKNPEKIRANNQIRIARINSLPHTLTEEEWLYSLEYFDYSCAYCGTHQDQLGEVLNQEHVIPVVDGGGYVAENIIPSCKRCNSSKHARRFEEWYPEQEYFSEDRMGKILNYIEN